MDSQGFDGLPAAASAQPPASAPGGFSARWLALREPADRQARHSGLAEDLALRLAAHAGQDAEQRIVDLGCGTGANLRATAPLLGARQAWRLLDQDPALLAEARRQISAWGEARGMRVAAAQEHLRLEDGTRCIQVAFVEADLAAGFDAVGAGAPHLVTASAFFDLASAAWIARFAAVVAHQRALFFTVLTCDGRDAWHPPHAADGVVHDAFRHHQGRDKGFGPAAGPDAMRHLAEAFAAAGYGIRREDSPWRLGEKDRALVEALADGMAGAVAETGLIADATLEGWRTARREAACTIGHADLLAWPLTGD